MKKNFLYSCLVGAALLVSGCGNASVEDDFLFGKVRVSCAGETITVTAPFELGVNGKMADTADKNAETVHAVGQNRYMQVLVTGTSEGKTPDAQADEAVLLMEKSAAVKNLKTTRKSIAIDGGEGVKLTFDFVNTEKGRETPLTVTEYLFRGKTALWRVIYQYRTQDETGRALTEKVEGAITRGATF